MRLVAGKASENHPALLWDVRPLWAPQLSPGLWFSSSAVTPIFPVSRGVRVLPCVSELNVVSPITWGKIALQNKCINSYLFSIFFVLEVRSHRLQPLGQSPPWPMFVQPQNEEQFLHLYRIVKKAKKHKRDPCDSQSLNYLLCCPLRESARPLALHQF